MSDKKKVTLGEHVADTHRAKERLGNVVTGDVVSGDVVPEDDEEKPTETTDAAEETSEGGEDS